MYNASDLSVRLELDNANDLISIFLMIFIGMYKQLHLNACALEKLR